MPDHEPKAFDAVRLMRELRDAQDDTMSSMSSAERLEYIRTRAEHTWRELMSGPTGERPRTSAR